jgi:hypothetical protein
VDALAVSRQLFALPCPSPHDKAMPVEAGVIAHALGDERFESAILGDIISPCPSSPPHLDPDCASAARAAPQ